MICDNPVAALESWVAKNRANGARRKVVMDRVISLGIRPRPIKFVFLDKISEDAPDPALPLVGAERGESDTGNRND